MTTTMIRAALASTVLMGSVAAARGEAVTSENVYLDMGFEELLQVEVTSNSRRAQSIEESAASVFVISQEDIRRSPARNVPELLRMVPGVQVQRLDHNNYRVSIRGGSQLYANKLLVMVDGRSIYTPTFGGVFWDQHDLRLDDIDRIEVVRGPGGTVWGANATNGVINIITRSAADTTGLYANLEVGTEDEPTFGLRIGGDLATGGAARLGLLVMRKPDISPNAPFVQPGSGLTIGGSNEYETGKVDFRLDQPLGEKTALTLTAAVQEGVFGEAFARGAGFVQAHVLARVERETASGGVTVQAFADHSDREGYGAGVTLNTYDIDFSHHLATGRHQFVWGGGFRYWDDEFTKVVQDTAEDDWRVSLFAQDEIAFDDETLRLTFGTKLEYNSITGFEYQPSLRVLKQFTDTRTAWGAVSRSVRTPSRADRSVQFDVALDEATGLPVTLFGNPDIDAEKAVTVELGYRNRMTPRFSWEASVFATQHDDLVVSTPNPETAPPFFPVFANRLRNAGRARSAGVEIAANARPVDPLTLQLAYAYTDLDVDNDDPAALRVPGRKEVLFSDVGLSRHTASLRATYEATETVSATAWARYATEPVLSGVGEQWDLDLRLTWAPGPVRASLIGENLLSDDESYEGAEYLPTLTERSPTERRFTAKLEMDL